MVDEGRPTLHTEPKGRERGVFTLAGRVMRWDAIARELTIGGRVLQVAASRRRPCHCHGHRQWVPAAGPERPVDRDAPAARLKVSRAGSTR